MVRSTLMAPYIFIPLLLLTCIYALWRGRREEKIAALVCLAATLATRFLISPLHIRYSGLEIGLLAVDLAVLAAFLALALKSQRFWPLWIAGLQLTNSTAHLLKGVEVELMPHAYGAAMVFWSYPILLIILAGTWRSHQRALPSTPGEP